MTNIKQLTKAAIIIILIALLLIPTWYISNLVMERKQRKQEITREITRTWASQQTISAPYLHVIYLKKQANTTLTNNGYIMSNTNTITNNVKTNTLKRSIYNVPVYTNTLQMEGNFEKESIEKFKNNFGEIDFTKSYLAINIIDSRGLVDAATITINGKKQMLSVNSFLDVNEAKTLQIPIANILEYINSDFAYTINFTLKGTEKINFIPLASSNTVVVHANWKDPSFEGISTSEKTIDTGGFTATWKINGNSVGVPKIAESWLPSNSISFGVNFINMVDSYSQTLRCIKYAFLFIALTFAFFYFIEILKNTQIHPIQYVLVGFALVIFYTLLLSIAEYISFGLAYLIASIATVLLISFYAKSIMQSNKNGILIGIVLTCLYTFMYIIIQLEETSLLVGSIGLFVILAIIMQLSKKINWKINSINTK